MNETQAPVSASYLMSRERERDLALTLAAHAQEMAELKRMLRTEPRLIVMVAAGTFIGVLVGSVLTITTVATVTIIAELVEYVINAGVTP